MNKRDRDQKLDGKKVEFGNFAKLKLVPVTIKLPEEYKKVIGQIAFDEDRSSTAVIKRCIERQFIDEYKIDLRSIYNL